jgi:hypothetical protein
LLCPLLVYVWEFPFRTNNIENYGVALLGVAWFALGGGVVNYVVRTLKIFLETVATWDDKPQ